LDIVFGHDGLRRNVFNLDSHVDRQELLGKGHNVEQAWVKGLVVLSEPSHKPNSALWHRLIWIREAVALFQGNSERVWLFTPRATGATYRTGNGAQAAVAVAQTLEHAFVAGVA
jgi:hypothetical protein